MIYIYHICQSIRKPKANKNCKTAMNLKLHENKIGKTNNLLLSKYVLITFSPFGIIIQYFDSILAAVNETADMLKRN